MARECGRRIGKVIRDPFHETLYTHYQLCEHKRIEGLIRDAEGLLAAKRTAIAFHEPKDLQEERTELLFRMGVMPSVSEALEKGRKMIEDIRRIDERQAATAAAGSGSGEDRGND